MKRALHFLLCAALILAFMVVYRLAFGRDVDTLIDGGSARAPSSIEWREDDNNSPNAGHGSTDENAAPGKAVDSRPVQSPSDEVAIVQNGEVNDSVTGMPDASDIDDVQSADPKDDVVIYVEKAFFGAKVTVIIDERGKPDYKGASHFSIMDGSTLISGIAPLDSCTTIFPAKQPGDAVTLKLLDDHNNEIAELNAVLKAKP